MIRRITGTLESLEGQAALLHRPALDVAVEVLVPRYLADRLLERIGRETTLHTIELYEGVGQGTHFVPRLIGFGSESERRFFELFTSVKGLGVRKGLRALAREPTHVAHAIAERDVKALQQLPEIGKKLGETLVLELRDKLEPWGATGSSEPMTVGEPKPRAGPQRDAISALVLLGETEPDAQRRVEQALAGGADPQDSDALVAAALAASG